MIRRLPTSPLCSLLGLAAAVTVGLGGAPRSWAAEPVSVVSLSGEVRRGDLLTLDEARLVTRLGDSTTETLIGDVLEIRFAPQATGGHTTADRAVVELHDGTRLAIESATLSEEHLAVRVPSLDRLDRSGEIRLPLSAARSLRLAPASRFTTEWRELSDETNPQDRIVVLRNGGKAIRSVPCVIEQINAEEVRVRLGNDSLAVPRDKVYGVLFASPDERGPAVTAFAHFVSGDRLAVDRIVLRGEGTLELIGCCGETFRVPVTKVHRIDYSPSRVRWLAEAAVVSHRWRPAMGFPRGQAEEDRPRGWRRDTALDGEPLRVARGSAAALEFQRGVAIRSGASIEFEIPDGFTRLRATAGIDPRTAAVGTVLLQAYADDRLVYEHTVDGSGAVQVLADLGNADRLRLVVGYGENLDFGDNLHLGAARLTK